MRVIETSITIREPVHVVSSNIERTFTFMIGPGIPRSGAMDALHLSHVVEHGSSGVRPGSTSYRGRPWDMLNAGEGYLSSITMSITRRISRKWNVNAIGGGIIHILGHGCLS